MKQWFKRTGKLFYDAYQEWSDDNAARLGAALAYYAIFSIAPVLILVVAVVSLIWGNQTEAVHSQLMRYVEDYVGTDGARTIESILDQSSRSETGGIIATVVGTVTLILGGTGVFVQLQSSLNVIWEVESRPGAAWRSFLLSRLVSFSLIVAIGLVLLAAVVASTLVSALGDTVTGVFNLVGSLGVITVLFALVFKVLPDVEVDWRDVWFGASITALLFVFGKFALGVYLGNSSTASSFGAAGSLVALLVWIYYSAQIFFFGAELTQVYARQKGREIRSSLHAVPVVASTPSDRTLTPVSSAPPGHRRAHDKRLVPLATAFLLGLFIGRRR